MNLNTTRFGSILISHDDLFLFPQGLIGFAEHRQWVLLSDALHDGLGWLQSATRPDLAVAVVSPRNCFPDYRVRIDSNQLATVDLGAFNRAFVLNIVAMNKGQLTVNLRAPLLFNLERRLGCQVVTTDEQPLQTPWRPAVTPSRKIA